MSIPDAASKEFDKNVEESDGALANSDDDDKIMHKVLPTEKDIERGDMINEALNKGISSFKPDLMFENLVKNYRMCSEIYGETILRQVTGYGTDEIERNMKIPEFQRDVKEKIKRSIKELKQENILNSEGEIDNKKALHLAKLSLLVTLDKIKTKSIFGDNVSDMQDIYGENDEIINYKKGMPFRDISVKATVKTAIRRNHDNPDMTDLKMHTKKSKKCVTFVYAMDASGSMKGKKIRVSKESGLAMAFQAIENKDKVGAIVFGKDINVRVDPGLDFNLILDAFVNIRATGKTDFIKALSTSHAMLSKEKGERHIVIITDALPTVGDDPYKESMDEVLNIANDDITISIIGIGVNKEGEEFASELALKGNGKFYMVKNLDELNYIVLEDYHAFS